MPAINRTVTTLLVALGGLSCGTTSWANVWVFEPSISFDQRFDDNYFLSPAGAGSLSATRLVGDLGISRESETFVVKGLARLDGLLTSNTDVGDEDLDSNRIFILDARRRTERSRFDIRAGYKLDTPSRDIAADISDSASLAEDTGLLVTQSLNSNVQREEIVLEPSFEYDVTRRLQFDAGLILTSVEHALPDPQDVIYQQHLGNPRDTENNVLDEPLPYDEVTIDNVGVFSPNGELDNYKEAELELGFRFKMSPISTLSATASYSQFTSDVTPVSSVPFDAQVEGSDIRQELLIPDDDVRQILRKPRFETVSTTARLVVGYERFLTPTLQFGINAGVYSNTSEFSDTSYFDNFPEASIEGSSLNTLFLEVNGEKTETDGRLASIRLVYDAGQTRYSGQFAVDVQPSSAGSQVETNELIGELQRALSPRLDFSFSARAFEPDRLSARATDRFSRRFISFEPVIRWKYSRNWTVSAAYRYRRQKARIDPESAESNAVLFAVKYTHPSEVRDRASATGL